MRCSAHTFLCELVELEARGQLCLPLELLVLVEQVAPWTGGSFRIWHQHVLQGVL